MDLLGDYSIYLFCTVVENELFDPASEKRLDWIGLDWIGLDWIGLDWIGFFL